MEAFIDVFRDTEYVQTPLFQTAKSLNLNTSVWATAFDVLTKRFILTLDNEDRILGINCKTLETEKELKSPLGGIRGLGVISSMRRGFFNSEYGNKMFSFDLDNFSIREEIAGFSIRPERIRVDPLGKILVTGNLGLRPFGGMLTRSILERLISTEGKVTDGMSMTLVDPEEEKVIATLPTGRRPTAVNISEKYIAAGNFWDNTVTIYSRTDTFTSFNVKVDIVKEGIFNFTLYDQFLKKMSRFRIHSNHA